jgi:hypothetical protein
MHINRNHAAVHISVMGGEQAANMPFTSKQDQVAHESSLHTERDPSVAANAPSG